eukprot:937439-Amphidinium_carterae.1
MQGSLPRTNGVKIQGDLRVSFDPSLQGQFEFRGSSELRTSAQGSSRGNPHLQERTRRET